ncbi:MAG: ABC transporter ATP-binding protein/permease [Thermoanaerobaculia bacterium]|nr:ABC transporter ATP-binding protein/permease [Thermoanaerobaculia bacterium]
MSIDLDDHEEPDLGKVYDRKLMRRLLGYMRPYRRHALTAVSLIVVSSLLQLVGPLLTAIALDVFVQPAIDPAGEPSARAAVSEWVAAALERHEIPTATGVGLLAGTFLVSLLLTLGVLWAQGYVMQMMGQLIMYDMRRDVFDRLQQLPVSFFDRQPIGRLVTRATSDIGALNEMFTSGLVAIFGDIVLLFGIVTVLFLLDWRLALVSFAILPLLFLLTLWFKTHARRNYREVRKQVARINAFLQEHIGGMSIVQLFGQERRSGSQFDGVAERHRVANVNAIYYYAVYYPGVELITALGLGLIVWYGGGEILRGALSVGALVAFLQYAQRFYQPLADLSEKYNILQAAMASSERIFDLLDTEPDIISPEGGYRPERIRGDVELEDVCFAYKENEPVLEDLSLRIEAGETVAVVGHTGAGKSTLANLLLRFYDVGRGSVKVDGVDVREWDLQRLRRGIGLVLQDVFLFAGDVAHNIRLGEDAIDDETLRSAAEEVRALAFIERLPDGFSSRVRERGAGLSVGQKQLIAFARALAFDPEILILDEATASIDSETEAWIQQALDRLLENRTSLVIAHRLSTIQKADRILVLHRGELREQGTHAELLALGGIYAKLHRLQFQDEGELTAATA